MPLRALVVLLCLSSPAAAGDAVDLSSWKAVQAAIGPAVTRLAALEREELELLRRGSGNAQARVAKSAEREDAEKALADLIDAALAGKSAADSWPDLQARVELLLEFANNTAGEDDARGPGVIASRIVAGLAGGSPENRAAIRGLYEKYWQFGLRAAGEKSARPRAAADSTAGIRQTLLDVLLGAVPRAQASEYEALDSLVIELFRTEAWWLPDLGNAEPMPVARAVTLLSTQPDTATLRPLLRLLHEMDQAAYETKERDRVNALLHKFVPELIELVRRLEIRTEGHDDIRAGTTSQFSAWFDVVTLLREFTQRTKIVWFDEWQEFWGANDGHTGGARFDFTRARSFPVPFGEEVIEPDDGDDDADGDSGKSTTGVPQEEENPDLPIPKIFGVEVKTSKFLIIVDCSGSMRKPGEVDRLTKLQQHTKEFIASLRKGTLYNILPFASTSEMEKSVAVEISKKPFLAKMSDPGRVDHATDKKVLSWIDKLHAEGSTNVGQAFAQAFFRPRGASDSWRPPFEEIFFITDGSPTDGSGQSLADTNQLVEQITLLNHRYRIPIHCIGFRGAGTDFLSQLQRENYGGSSPQVIE